MDDEFDKLLEIFSQNQEDKEKKLEDIFQKSIEFFEKYKYILAQGSEEEKIAIQKKMDLLRSKLSAENDAFHSTAGLSTEDIKQLANDSKNFTDEQWNFLQKARKELSIQKEEADKKIDATKEERKEELKEKKKKKKHISRKSKWMKS